MPEKEPPSLVCSGISDGGGLRFVAAELTETLESARLELDLGPLGTLAFAQAAVSAAMLLRLAAKVPSRLEVQVNGDGTLGRVFCQAEADGRLRGSVQNRHAVGSDGGEDLSLRSGFGSGLLTVRRIDQRGRVYDSQVGLVKGDLAYDLAHYLEQSEQRRSAVLLGVRIDERGLRRASGLVIEALPGADGNEISVVEDRISALGSVNAAVTNTGATGIESLLGEILGDGIRVQQTWRAEYRCGCSRESVAERLADLPQSELVELFAEDPVLVADCAYCQRQYSFAREELLTTH